MSSAIDNVDYKQILIAKLNELSEEAVELSHQKIEHEKHIADINIRLAHVVGAIQTIDSILDQDR